MKSGSFTVQGLVKARNNSKFTKMLRHLCSLLHKTELCRA